LSLTENGYRQDLEHRTSDILNNAIGRFKKIKPHTSCAGSSRIGKSGLLIVSTGFGDEKLRRTRRERERFIAGEKMAIFRGYQVDRVSTSDICGWKERTGQA